MTKTKKIAAAVLSLALVGSIAIGGTLAYLTDKEEDTNVFKIGDVDITLEEDNFEENKYFNRKEYIRFFVQDELPMFLENKNLIVDENRQIKFASNGHGNVFIA